MKDEMKRNEDLLSLILETAKNDDRIRAVVLNGSRVDSRSTVDYLSDFDIIYFVRGIRSFTSDNNWIERSFGPIMIMQKPEDWFSHPYDYNGDEPFVYLTHFVNGTRLDLTLIDLENIPQKFRGGDLEPGEILLWKDDMQSFAWPVDPEKYLVERPTAREFADTVNEFFWLATYVAKGIYRNQFLFVKTMRENIQAEMLLNVLSWSAAIDFDFSISTGKFHKYLQKFLAIEVWQQLQDSLSCSLLSAAFENEKKMMGLFDTHARKVALEMGFCYDSDTFKNVWSYLNKFEELGSGSID